MATWIKASERMPGWNVTCKWRMPPDREIQVTTAKNMMGWASMFLTTLEWFDESAPSIPEDVNIKARKAVKARIEKQDVPEKFHSMLTGVGFDMFLAGHAYRGQQGEWQLCPKCKGDICWQDTIVDGQNISITACTMCKGQGKILATSQSIPLSIVEALAAANPFPHIKNIGKEFQEEYKLVWEQCVSKLRELLQKDLPSNEPDKLQRLRNVLSDDSEQKRLRGKTIEHLTIQTVIAKIDLLIVNQ